MKKVSRPQYYRIQRILALIKSGTINGEYCSATVLARELDVSTRTILRDLDILRDDENAPIEYSPSRKGFFLHDKTWELPPVNISRNELFAFSIALTSTWKKNIY